MEADEFRKLVGLKPVGPQKPTQLPFVVKLPMPPSVNGLWETARSGKRVLSERARQYRKAIAPAFTGLTLEKGKLYRLLWLFSYSWWTQKGKLRIWDAPNRIKFLQDCIADFAGIDDCQFKEAATFERDGEFYCQVAIVPWTEQPLPDPLK